MGTTFLATILVVAIAILIAEYTTRPMRELTEAAQRLSSGELQRVSTISTRDEVGATAGADNTMATQLHAQIQALTSERGKLSAVLEQMTDGVVIVDENGLLQLINPTAERMFEVLQRGCPGASLAEVLRHFQLVELWQRCLETGELQEIYLDLGLKRLSIQGVAIPLGNPFPAASCCSSRM